MKEFKVTALYSIRNRSLRDYRDNLDLFGMKALISFESKRCDK